MLEGGKARSRWPEPTKNVGQSFDPSTVGGPNWKTRVKAGAYPLLLPVLTAWALRRERLLKTFDPFRFCFGGRGQEIDLLFLRLGADKINGRRILLQGVGRATEFGFLRSYSPRQIVGTDFRPEWDAAVEPDERGSRHLVAGDLARLPFQDESFDGAASINTFEHLRNLDAALAETVRVLRPGGWFLAIFGPLYQAIGGDHLSRLRGGLRHGYNHLLLEKEEYEDFIRAMTVQGVDVVDGQAQEGLAYIELDLFSRKTFSEYEAAFGRYLKVHYLRGYIDPEGVEFRQAYPEMWAKLLARGYSEKDLLISSIVVLGERKST